MQKLHQRLLLLAGNFRPELTGIGKYNGEMIEWLAQNDTIVQLLQHFHFILNGKNKNLTLNIHGIITKQSLIINFNYPFKSTDALIIFQKSIQLVLKELSLILLLR